MTWRRITQSPAIWKLQVSLVAAGVRFLRIGEPGTHPRVRHVGLDRNLRPGDRFAGGVGQFESDGGGADPGWLR